MTHQQLQSLFNDSDDKTIAEARSIAMHFGQLRFHKFLHVAATARGPARWTPTLCAGFFALQLILDKAAMSFCVLGSFLDFKDVASLDSSLKNLGVERFLKVS